LRLGVRPGVRRASAQACNPAAPAEPDVEGDRRRRLWSGGHGARGREGRGAHIRARSRARGGGPPRRRAIASDAVIPFLLVAAAQAVGVDEPRDGAPVVIVVSGGISLGSYLAGQLYVFQEVIRSAPVPRRLILAGAS